jgi:hypothetical protein
VSALSVKKVTRSASDEIDLVSCVGFLGIVTLWCVKLNGKGTVGKDGNGKVAGRRRSFG